MVERERDTPRELPPLSKKQTEMVYVRMSPELMVRMERRMAVENAKAMGRVTRSDFIRFCVQKYLDDVEGASGDGG
jgi:hypothetical protein